MASQELIRNLVRNELLDIVGEGDVSISEVDRYCYSTDVYWIRGCG